MNIIFIIKVSYIFISPPPPTPTPTEFQKRISTPSPLPFLLRVKEKRNSKGCFLRMQSSLKGKKLDTSLFVKSFVWKLATIYFTSIFKSIIKYKN